MKSENNLMTVILWKINFKKNQSNILFMWKRIIFSHFIRVTKIVLNIF